MRVLHVMPSLARSYGGPTYSLAGYLHAARSAGVESEVAAPEFTSGEAAWLSGQLPGLPVHLFPGRGSGAFVSAPMLWRWLGRVGDGYDVVHVHGLLNPVSSLSARISLRGGRPLVVRPFGMLSRYTFTHRRALLKRAFFRLLDGPTLTRAGGVHFTTPMEREEAAWHGVSFGSRARVVPPPWMGGVEGRAPERSGDSPPTALFLSRLDPKKNLEGLLAAWPEVVRTAPGARLVVAGDGEAGYVSALHRRVEALGLSRSVSFAGFVAGEEKARLLASADVFVLPSFHENFGVAVLEAMAAGLPAVVTPEVQLASFLREHRLGAVSGREPRELASAILGLLEDRALREECRARGPALVAEHFSPETIGRRLLEMYRAALSATRS